MTHNYTRGEFEPNERTVFLQNYEDSLAWLKTHEPRNWVANDAYGVRANMRRTRIIPADAEPESIAAAAGELAALWAYVEEAMPHLQIFVMDTRIGLTSGALKRLKEKPGTVRYQYYRNASAVWQAVKELPARLKKHSYPVDIIEAAEKLGVLAEDVFSVSAPQSLVASPVLGNAYQLDFDKGLNETFGELVNEHNLARLIDKVKKTVTLPPPEVRDIYLSDIALGAGRLCELVEFYQKHRGDARGITIRQAVAEKANATLNSLAAGHFGKRAQALYHELITINDRRKTNLDMSPRRRIQITNNGTAP